MCVCVSILLLNSCCYCCCFLSYLKSTTYILECLCYRVWLYCRRSLYLSIPCTTKRVFFSTVNCSFYMYLYIVSLLNAYLNQLDCICVENSRTSSKLLFVCPCAHTLFSLCLSLWPVSLSLDKQFNKRKSNFLPSGHLAENLCTTLDI